MAKSKGPWKRKGRGWWVWHGGRQVYLAGTKDAAWREFHLLMAGERPSETGILFREIADKFATHIRRNRSPRHAVDTKKRLNPFVQALWHRAASDLRWADVEAVVAKQPWNATTQAGHLIALRGCLRWAERTRLIESNPIPHVPIPRTTSRQDALDGEQVAALLSKATEPLRTILWALSVTGARPGELIAATVDQCDPDGTAIRLTESKVGRRTIYFPQADRPRVAALRADRSGPMFPAARGGRWTQTVFNGQFRRAKKAAGLPAWASPYSLRHTWITQRLRDRKLAVKEIADLAGTSTAMIEKVYGHLIDDDVKRSADLL